FPALSCALTVRVYCRPSVSSSCREAGRSAWLLDGHGPAVSGTVVLLELEVRHVIGSIRQLHNKLAARAEPALVCLPDVGVLLRAGIIRQAASARCDSLLHVI